MNHPNRSPAEYTPSLTIVEAVANDNLKNIRNIGDDTAFSTLLLINVASGKAAFGLEGPCDPINRDMLNKVYTAVGVSLEKPAQIRERTLGDREDSWVTYYDQRGVEIVERDAKQGDWQSFSVSITPPK